MACTSNCCKADRSWTYIETMITSMCNYTWSRCIKNGAYEWMASMRQRSARPNNLKWTSFINVHFYVIKQQCVIKASLSCVWLKYAYCHQRWHSYNTYAYQPSTKCDDKTAQKDDKEWWWDRCRLTIVVSPKVQSRDSVSTWNICAVAFFYSSSCRRRLPAATYEWSVCYGQSD